MNGERYLVRVGKPSVGLMRGLVLRFPAVAAGSVPLPVLDYLQLPVWVSIAIIAVMWLMVMARD